MTFKKKSAATVKVSGAPLLRQQSHYLPGGSKLIYSLRCFRIRFKTCVRSIREVQQALEIYRRSTCKSVRWLF
jgi:hypothetical protein